MENTLDHYEDLAGRLKSLGGRIGQMVVSGRDLANDHRVVEHIGGDAIFAIDRRVEPLILTEMEALPPHLLPLIVVCEGLGEDGIRRFGDADSPPKFRILIDPIDGTRSLMYDKRPAWFLAAVAPDRGEATSLSDAVVSVMVELPTSKQGLVDAFWTSGRGVLGEQRTLGGTLVRTLNPRPSSETTLRSGFGQVASFFPGTKRLAADLMERIAEATLGEITANEASIFDDQYISSGGQLVELMCGRDRFCCDLRPIFYEILAGRKDASAVGLCCHPYDMAGVGVARAAGVIVTDGYGRTLNAPFDVHSPVHWCGYANDTLRQTIEPVIQAWIAAQFVGA